jgi:hypothetical protein
MSGKILILSAVASLAVAVPSWAAENSGSAVVAAPGAAQATVICRGVQSVPVTADAEQALPLNVIAKLGCGAQVAVMSDMDGYTVKVNIGEGKDGYVARMYLSEPTVSKDRPAEAAVDNGIARWQAGAPGSDQFFSGDTPVESLTANGITVQVSLQDTGWKMRASVAIANESGSAVAFDPRAFTLDELRPRLRTLAYQDPTQLAKSNTHQVYSTNASAVPPASAVYTDVAYKMPTAVRKTQNFLAWDGEHAPTVVLAAATVAPKEKAAGVVWFERDRSAQQLTLRIFVDDQIFEFPLSFAQHN